MSRSIISENPHVKHRTAREILDLKLRKEEYILEYAQRESPKISTYYVLIGTTTRLELNRQQRSWERRPTRRRGCHPLPRFSRRGATIEHQSVLGIHKPMESTRLSGVGILSHDSRSSSWCPRRGLPAKEWAGSLQSQPLQVLAS